MTPSDVEVLMHCHFMCDPHPRMHAPAVRDAIAKFLRAGIVELCDVRAESARYRTTELGKQLVDAICATPVPKPRLCETCGAEAGYGEHVTRCTNCVEVEKGREFVKSKL